MVNDSLSSWCWRTEKNRERFLRSKQVQMHIPIDEVSRLLVEYQHSCYESKRQIRARLNNQTLGRWL